ncbi:MAG: hypothetical protein ACOY0T_09860 [Myxococcota bacterium]
MSSRRLLAWFGFASALAGCSDDENPNSVTTVPPHVFIDGIFTTNPGSSVSVPRPPERQSLSPLELPCDGYLGVRLAYENWEPKAPGLCGETVNCGHSSLTLSLAGASQSLGVVATPAFFTLLPREPWNGSARLVVELRNDAGTPHLVEQSPVRDELDIPLTLADCSANAQGGASNGDPDAEGGASSAGGGAGGSQ